MAFIHSSLPLRNPTSLRRQASTTPVRSSPRASASVSRRQALQFAGALLAGSALSLAPGAAKALSMDEERVTKALATLREARGRAMTLREEAAKWRKSTAVDDAEATLRISAIWLEPARVQLAALPDLPARVDIGDRDAVRTQAGLLMGHLLELSMEAENRRSEGVVRELDEFVETADDVLAIPALKKFVRE